MFYNLSELAITHVNDNTVLVDAKKGISIELQYYQEQKPTQAIAEDVYYDYHAQGHRSYEEETSLFETPGCFTSSIHKRVFDED